MSDDKIVKLHGHDDPELEALYQQAEKPVPPAHLDAVIKQAAREEHLPHKTKLTPWFAGIAVSVLAGVLFIQLYPTSLPQQPASYLEKESRYETTAPVQTMSRESDALQDMPARAPEAARQNQLKPGQLLERKRSQASFSAGDSAMPLQLEERAVVSSPALKTLQDTGGVSMDADLASEVRAIAPSAEKSVADAEPQALLKHILELLDQGKTEDAKQAYAEFNKQYPDFKLEADIAHRLESL